MRIATYRFFGDFYNATSRAKEESSASLEGKKKGFCEEI